MNYSEFLDDVMEKMREQYPDYVFGRQAVRKLQGQSYEGMSVIKPGTNIAATVNLMDLHESMENGMPMSEAYRILGEIVANAVKDLPVIDVEELNDYEAVKSKLTLQMIPVAGNEDMLKEVPHRITVDTALVYRIEIGRKEDEVSSTLVTNDMLKRYGVDVETLHTDAVANSERLYPATLRPIFEVLEMITGIPCEAPPEEASTMWVASIQEGVNGACVIQYPGFLEMAAEKLGGDFYILPSSVHELIFIKDGPDVDPLGLEEMVHTVNETQVAPDERLSNSVLKYDSASNRILLGIDPQEKEEINNVLDAGCPAVAHEARSESEERS